MKFIIIILLLLIPPSILAQYGAYYPNGKKINIEFKTIRQLLDSMGVKETESHIHKLGSVYFKKLSNIPLFVIFNEKDYPSKIKDIIKSYDYNSYLYSYSYYYDLTKMMKSSTLTKKYLDEVFGDPTNTISGKGKTTAYIYKKYNARIEFNDSIAMSVDVINYNALEKCKFAIQSWQVTGSDYSIGMDITLSNLSEKIIKYIYITVTAKNPVDDKVGTKTLKAVGPIYSNDSGSYSFEDIIYSKTASSLSLDKIKVEYMDKTTKTFSKLDIRNITVEDWEEVGNRVVH
jgi:hypothetical protein